MLRFLATLFFISFLLNFTWEISQMGFYSTLGMGDISDYWNFVLIHWQVSLKDALMVVLVCLAIGLIFRDLPWFKNINKKWILLLALPIWQAVIEYYSVYVYGRWGYAESMPLISGIGLLPILQMLILPSIAILLSRGVFSDSCLRHVSASAPQHAVE